MSNAERSSPNGGVGALRFDASGEIVDAYQTLSGTSRNCAGGATPWDNWLSCEEVDYGYVFETDPWGERDPDRRSTRPATGSTSPRSEAPPAAPPVASRTR